MQTSLSFNPSRPFHDLNEAGAGRCNEMSANWLGNRTETTTGVNLDIYVVRCRGSANHWCPLEEDYGSSIPATHTDFISINRYFTLRIEQNTDFLP